MITARLHGRLGNQMFQYAAARALSLRLGTALALDDRAARAKGQGDLRRVFDLPVLAKPDLPPARRDAPLRYALWRAFSPRFIRERGLGYNPQLSNLGDGAYLHGYWQSERYFADVASQIRTDFTLPALRGRALEVAGHITATEAIALHVRRGDYVALSAHALCSQAYYRAALGKIADGLERPQVFVFSDDPEWARENLTFPLPRVVVDLGGADYDDMHLMSLCDHMVLANSSFSWWAAWLGETAQSRIAGPARWFGDPKLHNPDILPPRWLRVAE